ncbi:MAG TPA: hypothetical protein PLO14_01365 [Accumulibacter sp.]|uniref:hypothetical protein n=1 Tax=Accumulibacter sp. TaxID=2053492 RepID=UPI0025D6267A|nr:hypothetical protein [Accumulibacter sp.]MCM8598673.1 hypothetical protein [Accumulibacter sp.]MCM8662836.1 hypothetical protein [Accumulibacter sp.]HNC50875.1 hypothetical protein [Accumulibacter sp.]
MLGATTTWGDALPLFGLTLGLAIRRTIRLAVSRGERDLDLDEFIPLLVGTIALGNGEEFAEPATRILGRRVIHGDIMTHTATILQQP